MNKETESTEQKFNIGQFLSTQKRQIEAALPKHLTADRMLRIVMTEIRKNPKLTQCTAASLIGSIIQCSQLGLEPGGALGHAHLIPYDINRNMGTKKDQKWIKIKECQFMIGYRGMMDLALRSEKVLDIDAIAVYERDLFEFEYGSNAFLKHRPSLKDPGLYIASYAIATLSNGVRRFKVMPKSRIDEARSRSKSSDNGPWVTDYDEMANKTVIKRLCKYLPVSIELQKAISLDDASDRGEQENSLIIEGEIDQTEINKERGAANESSKAGRLAGDLDAEKAAKAEKEVKEFFNE